MKLAPFATATLAALFATPALGADLRVDLEIPRIGAAEYHYPYVAVWVERPDQTAVMNLAVWYDHDMRNDEGLRYLADLRAWWRKIGRETTLPIDGVSGATRAPGVNSITLRSAEAPLRNLAQGQYNIVIEAAREQGGREVIRIPLEWNGRSQTIAARGSSEIGAVTVTVGR
jgi:hypothetical protein